MTDSRSKSLLITLTLIVLVLSSLLGAGIYYIRNMNTHAALLLNEADSVAETAVLAQSVRVVREEAQADIEAFNNMMLSSDSSILLIEEIEDAGVALGLETRTVKVGNLENTNAGEPRMLSLTVESVGSWAQNLSFLKAIESLPHKVMVDETRFRKEDLAWRLTVTLKLYLFNSNE